MMNKLESIVFESLGDNCEFAFYLRDQGVDNGSLFRWALIKDYSSLLALLKSNFNGIYEHDNLEPSWRDMVRDKSCDICFHTELYSHQEDGVWVFNESKTVREDTYKKEKQKIDYLVDKFRSSMHSPNTIFVIKNNNNNAENFIQDIAKTLAYIGSAKILYVKISDENNDTGSVQHLGHNLYYGYIDRFADYHAEDQFSHEGWKTILENFSKL